MIVNNNRIIERDHRLRPEWGFETGVEGRQNNRQVLLKELHNYQRITHNGFNFYISIIDTKHPKFIRTTDKGFERWRMRFNVFSSGFFAQWLPNTVLHLGELHVYYDLMPDKPKPWCYDFTFYYDDRAIGSEVITNRYQLMDMAFRDSLIGTNQHMKYLLILPISPNRFVSPNRDLEEFLERQEVILSQLDQIRKRNQMLAKQPITAHQSHKPINQFIVSSDSYKSKSFQNYY